MCVLLLRVGDAQPVDQLQRVHERAAGQGQLSEDGQQMVGEVGHVAASASAAGTGDGFRAALFDGALPPPPHIRIGALEVPQTVAEVRVHEQSLQQNVDCTQRAEGQDARVRNGTEGWGRTVNDCNGVRAVRPTVARGS